VETFRDRLKELKPDVRSSASTGDVGKLERAVRHRHPQQNPDALYVSLFGSDWIAFVREARSAALRQDVRGRHPARRAEYIDPLGPRREGCSSPLSCTTSARRPQGLRRALHQEYDKNPVLGSLVGYVTYLSIFEALRKRVHRHDKLVAAFAA